MRLRPFLAALLGLGSASIGALAVHALDGAAPSPLPQSKQPQIECNESPVRKIYFDFDRHDIRPDQMEPLGRLAAWMSACPVVKVRLEGHTDDRYSEKHSMALSLKLAESVRTFLVAEGIHESRLKTLGMGRSRPADRGKSEKSQTLNRRVEILVEFPACDSKAIRLFGTTVIYHAVQGKDGSSEAVVEVGDLSRGWKSEDPLLWNELYLEIDPKLVKGKARWTVRVTRWTGDAEDRNPPLRLEPPERGRILTLRLVGRKNWASIPAEEDRPPIRYPLYLLEYKGKPDVGGMPLIQFLLDDLHADGQLRFLLERDGVPACEIRMKTYSPGC